MDVVHALDASNALKNDLITAATIQGEVTLSGTVSNEASRELAESIASHVPGVTKVHNDLTVANPEDAQEAQESNAGAQQGAPSDVPQPGYGQDEGEAPSSPPPPARSLAPAYEVSNAPVTIPQGTLLQVRTSEPVSSKRAEEGTAVQFTVIRDVVFGGVLAIPRGATVHGVVTETKKSGALAGSPELALQLTSLDLGGQNYPLHSDLFKVKGPNKAGQTVRNAFGTALLGALIGGVADRGTGAAIGAATGAGVGTAVTAASPGPGVWIPAEALVDFHLAAPVTVTPVSPQEAARLAQALYPGGPFRYRRGVYPYPGPYAYRYAYPPVYFRPYYTVGGFYSWR
jgi:guanyl-specific ribonuclease Sa